MNGTSALAQYRAARKRGEREVARLEHLGRSPYPAVLDEVYGEVMLGGTLDLGVLDVPIELFAGTKSRGRKEAFSAGFMPLLGPASEFAGKWVSLYGKLEAEGLREPLECYECLGRFYVAEGNKRLSILAFNGAVEVPAHVVRVLTLPSDDPADARYRDLLHVFKCTHSYVLRFGLPGQFPKLQAALGFDAEHVWTSDDHKRFRAGYARFLQAMGKARGIPRSLSGPDALVLWLHFYPFEQLRSMTERELVTSIDGLELALAQADGVAPAFEPEPAPGGESLWELSRSWLAGRAL